MKILFSFVVCEFFLLVVFCGAGQAQNLTEVTPQGDTQLQAETKSGSPIKVVLSQAAFNDSYPYKGAQLWGGDMTLPPKTVLVSVSAEVGNEKLFLPLSSYSDLGAVKRSSLEITAKGFILHFHGGDTATSYDATLVFEDGYLHSRKVTLREFSRQRWEETVYSFNRAEN